MGILWGMQLRNEGTETEVANERLMKEKVTTEKVKKEEVMKSDTLLGDLIFSAGSSACR